ncbi:MAG TPA: PHB depolymerase family esterase [Capillimicrobium sp.]
MPWALRTALLALAVAGPACGPQRQSDPADEARAGDRAAPGRLTARFDGEPPSGPGIGAGLHRLEVDGGRPALLWVPAAAARGAPAPLVVAFHGAGSSATTGMRLARKLAEETGAIALASSSRGPTWDVIARGGFGPDVAAVDRLLRRVGRGLRVDPDRIAVAGFSDGASYALSLGLANGDLFRAILAFSPGFTAPGPRHGRPAVYVTHGTRDNVLPIDATSRRIVPALRDAGYDVALREFDGGHEVPQDRVDDALAEALGGRGA